MEINLNQLLLLYNIENKNLNPIDKLINEEELNMILNNYSFKNEVTSIPYLFFINNETTENQIHCFYKNKKVCTIIVESIFKIKKEKVAEKVFNTTSLQHPGVKTFLNESGICLSGFIVDFNKEIIKELNIPYIENTSCDFVFQSRNPPHAAHEEIIKKYSPNLLYSTPYSTAKQSDYSFETKIKTYEKIKELYNVEIFVSTLPRIFAGPREALQNMILFKNLGCKNIIFGRGKNCVGDFYGDLESYDFCKKFEDVLGVKILFQETIYFNGEELKASNIKLKYVDNNITPPKEFMSSYISDILLNKNKIIYITGLSGSGKTTISKKLQKLIPNSILLDGDEIRNSINRDLGFDYDSKVENIRRNNDLITLLNSQGFTIICSFMASIGSERDKLFENNDNVIKIQLTTSLKECMRRNTKNLYNEDIKNLSGFNFKYDELKEPHLKLDTSVLTVQECVDNILTLLKVIK